jgi:hypothetical protein
MKERGEGEPDFLQMEVLVLSVQASGPLWTSVDNFAPQVGLERPARSESLL